MDEINLTPLVSSQKGLSVIAKIIGGAVILGVAGLGICFGTRVLDPLWNPFRPSLEKVIEEISTSMEEVKTMHSKGDIEIAISEDKFLITFEGDSDARDSENMKLDGELGITSDGMQKFSLNVSNRIIGDTTYLKLNEIVGPPNIESLFLILGVNLDEIKDQWIMFDEEALEKLGGAYSSQEISREEQEKMTKKIQELFTGRKIYYVKEEMPDEKINGKKAYHYLITLDKEEIKEVVPEILRISMESSGQSLGMDEFSVAFMIGGLTESINQFFEKVGDIIVGIWIGKKDNLLYRIEGEKEIDLSNLNAGFSGILNLKIAFDFSNFNQPVEIQTPENFKTLEEVFVIPQTVY